MRDIRDVIGFFIDLCDHCNPPADVLELDASPDSDDGVTAFIRPDMLHHSCPLRVTIPMQTSQDDAIALLENMAQRLREDPIYLETLWSSQEHDDEQVLPVEPGGHFH